MTFSDETSSSGEEVYNKNAGKSNDREIEGMDDDVAGGWQKQRRRMKRKDRPSHSKSFMEVELDEKRLRKNSTTSTGTSFTTEKIHSEKTVEAQNLEFNLTVIFTGLQGNICLISPVKLAQAINKAIGKTDKMFKIKEKKILKVKCMNPKQVKRALEIQELAGLPVSVENWKPYIENNKGVIHKVDTLITEEELYEELKDQGVTHTKRFMKRIDGEMCPTPSVLLFFKPQVKPTFVTIIAEKYWIAEYRAPLKRCFKCQQFGHIAKDGCKVVCVRCGGNHSFSDCQVKDNPKCFRCQGNHSAAYQGCPAYKEAKEIQELKIDFKISYAQATKQYRTQQSSVHTQELKTTQNETESKPAETQTSPNKNIQQPIENIVSMKSIGTQTDDPVLYTPAMNNPNSKETAMEIDHTTQSTIDNSKFNLDVAFLSFISIIIDNLDKGSVNTGTNTIKMVVEAAKSCLDIDVEEDVIRKRLK